MLARRSILLFLLYSVIVCEAVSENDVEPRGKKKKIALFVFIADLVLKKFFVLKLVYAFIFWLVIHKAGYFLTWFISYLKEQSHHHHHPHHEYGPHYDHSYGPYRRESHGIRS
ncbi:uncharacterized protein LOC123692834 [Colias croceus]|uniref:uncharacterized protein LOC123692834 n=1 Tax=Colias crocea TaxID=72248 RepID=UPI001E27E3F9|nr:uncharacterized protein LOC123692834 [Colias croceus]CAG4953713.1 unnamed protein product [Colias eurytheme]